MKTILLPLIVLRDKELFTLGVTALRRGDRGAARQAFLTAYQSGEKLDPTRQQQAKHGRFVEREQQKQQLAPVAGVVSDTFFRAGEFVNTGQPVVALLPRIRSAAGPALPRARRGDTATGGQGARGRAMRTRHSLWEPSAAAARPRSSRCRPSPAAAVRWAARGWGRPAG